MRNIMMTAILTFLLQATNAHSTELNCQSFGPGRELEIVVTAEQDIFSGPSDAVLTASGMFVNTFILKLSPLEVSEDVVVLGLETTTNTGALLTGTLTIELTEPISGKIELENTAGTFNPRLVPRYDLSNCTLI